LNVIFAGTPAFAARILEAIIGSAHPHRIIAVLTQPDRPAGRGLQSNISEVKLVANEHGIPVLQPGSLRDRGLQAQLIGLTPDIMVVAAYGLILPEEILAIPRHGAVNVHASLLPRWRGAAPIQRALLAGDRETGTSIMQMDAGLDTGPVLLQERIPITAEDTAGSLHDRLTTVGATLCVRALDAIAAGTPVPIAQDAKLATYAKKLDKTETRIEWRDAAEAVCRHIRAFNPVPGARTNIRGTEVKIWRCQTSRGDGAPGQVLEATDRGLVIACAQGAILAAELQRANGKRLGAAEFLRGFPLSPGERFDGDAG
jgi:methionyl-tRNA formyltransferase